MGGAVRDALLGLPVSERDWVVVGATPQQMPVLGFRQVDPDFPVFRHPDTGEEYALARQELKKGTGYRGFVVDANPDVTLEQDLARRDLTINAIAQDQQGKLFDPYNGQDDLRNRKLRHVASAFSEDPVRLLRIARFAAKLGLFDFRVADTTQQIMQSMVIDGAVQELKPERIWQEMKKVLGYQQPWHFFATLHACGALKILFPSLADPLLLKMEQGNAASGVSLRQACKLSEKPRVRFAALFLTKDLPGWLSAVMEKRFALLLKQARVAWAILENLTENSAEEIYHFLQQHRAWQQDGLFIETMQVLQAQSKHSALLAKINQAQQVAAKIDVAQLKDQGLNGAALGQAIKEHRIQAISGSLFRGAG